ncbi:MAG: YeeE/YedE family protein [Burkholderiaceae bacterium]
MQESDLAALHQTVVWSTFVLGLIMGALMSRSNFCTMGAVADILNMGDWTRMRMWLCAIGVAIIGTQLLAFTGLVDISRSLYTGPDLLWLSTAAGGLLFGFGMVLASGCGSKTLVRIGGGSLKSLAVFIVMGLAAYMTLRGIFGVFRVAAVDSMRIHLPGGQDLPRLLAGDSADALARLRLVLGLGIGALLLAFSFAGREFRRLENAIGGVGVGLIIVAGWYVSGHLGYVEEHPRTLEQAFIATNSGRPESFSFVAPVAYTLDLLMLWSDTSRQVSFGIAAVLGMIGGSFLYALLTRRFRWEGLHGTEDTANHLAGGALMGIGGVTALGCTIGQGLSGLSTLALGSLIAFVFILVGAWAGMKYQGWRIERMI